MPSVLKTVFLSLNSHIFFFVVDQCWRRQRQASKNADACSAFELQLSSRNRRCTQAKTNLFSRRSQRKPLQAARMSFERKSYLRAIPTNYFYLSLLKVFTPKYLYCQSRQHQAIQLWLYPLQFIIIIYSFGGTAHWSNRHRDSARSHSRFTFDHGSRIFQSLPTKNQSAIC